jgi:hypothetical protein
MRRIEATKGGVLADSFSWILGQQDFKKWRHVDRSQLLWINGNPGKGKTMLLIGIIKELSRQLESTCPSGIISYFFCQGTDSKLNNSTAVLRGLTYLLLIQQKLLFSHLREKYDHAGGQLFEDANAFYALSQVFGDILHDPSLTTTYLIIDALDECESGSAELLNLIARSLCTPSRVKWIVSSRNRPDIEQRLWQCDGPLILSLELNAAHVSSAVNIYIDHKVSELALLKQYDSTLQHQVNYQLRQKAHGTFLWVAFVCKELQTVESWNTLQVLEDIPVDLKPLYDRMVDQIRLLKQDNREFCWNILSTTAHAYRPPHLLELAVLAGLPEQLSSEVQSLIRIVGLCGSFLAIREDRVYFIHQSARDYIVANASAEVFPTGCKEVHLRILSRSLQAMAKTLRRDIYDLRDPGILIDQVSQVNPDPLASIRYSCVYWIDHLCEMYSSSHSEHELRDEGIVHTFLQKSFLYWLEALSIMRSMSNGVRAIGRLENVLLVSYYRYKINIRMRI